MTSCFPSLVGRLGGSFVLSSALIGCAQSTVQAEPAAPSQPAAVFEDGAVGRYQSLRFGFALTLPDGASWRIEDDRSPWVEATHEATSSRLRVRGSIERTALSREACLENARGFGVPDLEDAIVLDDRVEPLSGEEASVWLRAGVRRGEDEVIEGVVVASAVSLRRCLVLVYETLTTDLISISRRILALGPHPPAPSPASGEGEPASRKISLFAVKLTAPPLISGAGHWGQRRQPWGGGVVNRRQPREFQRSGQSSARQGRAPRTVPYPVGWGVRSPAVTRLPSNSGVGPG